MTQNRKSRQDRLQKKATPTSKKSSKKASLGKKLLITALALFVAFTVAGVVSFFVLISDAPKLDETLLKDPVPSKLFAANGKKFEEMGVQNRELLSYNEIPKVLEDAVLSIEDRNFYNHRGIDIKRTAAAVLGVFTSGGLEGQGGSTITQQIVKLSFLTTEKTIKRKAQEWYLAYQLEKKKSKQEILEIYLNKIYYWNGVYGVKKAAEVYFDKELEELTLAEAATLAGIPQRPAAYDLYKHPEAAEKRRNTVLQAMVDNGKITEAEKAEATKIPVKDLVVEPDKEGSFTETNYQHFINEVQKEVAELSDNRLNIYTDGLEIYTTMDVNAQQTVEDILNTNKYISYPNDRFQAGVVLMDTKTGEIRAIGGGRNNATARGFSFATDIKRQPGSTAKPIVDYGPAIEYLKWGTGKRLKDEPYSYSTGDPINNSDNKFRGEMTMRDALAYSRNIPALKTFQEVGTDRISEFTKGLGFNFKNLYESYSIGAFEASPLQMAAAYAAFGNSGIYNKPHTIVKIVLPDGQVIKNSQYLPKPQQVMKDYTAFMVTDMLRSVVDYGTGTRGNVSGLDIAGKTGSTNYDKKDLARYGLPRGATKDVWFAGYTPELTAAVWTGYEKNSSENYIRNVDYGIAARIFKNLMSKAATEKTKFKVPSSVYKANGEYYVKGTEAEKPIVKVQQVTDVKAAYNKESNSIDLSWNYPDEAEVVFEINYKKNGQDSTLLAKTTSTTATLPNVEAGATYSFTITAVFENETGKAVTVTVTVPIVEVVPPPTEEVPPPDEGDGNNDGDDGNNDGDGGNNGGDDGNDGDGGNNGGNTGGNEGTTPPPIPGTTPPGQNNNDDDDDD